MRVPIPYIGPIPRRFPTRLLRHHSRFLFFFNTLPTFIFLFFTSRFQLRIVIYLPLDIIIPTPSTFIMHIYTCRCKSISILYFPFHIRVQLIQYPSQEYVQQNKRIVILRPKTRSNIIKHPINLLHLLPPFF